MFASREVEIPFWRGVGRQRGWGFGTLAQVIGRTTIPILRNISSHLQNAWALTGWSLLCQKLQILLLLEKISRQLQRGWEDRLWGNMWVVVAGKRLRVDSFQKNLKNTSVGREEKFLQKLFIPHVEHLSVPTICGSFWKSWRVSPSSWRCLEVPQRRNSSNYLTWWKLHSVWISNGLQPIRWFESDIFGFEVEIRRGSWLWNLQYQRSNKGAKKEAKADEETVVAQEEQVAPVSLFTRVNNILHSISSNVEVYNNNQQN